MKTSLLHDGDAETFALKVCAYAIGDYGDHDDDM